MSHSPLFQVMFTLQNAGGGGGALPGLQRERSRGGADDRQVRSHPGARGDPAGPARRTELQHATSSSAARPNGCSATWQRVLEQVAADADVRLSRLELLGEAERALVLEEWSRTEAEYPANRCVHELFAEQAARTPGAVAVVFEGAELTYAELDARANQLAHYLRGAGRGAGGARGAVRGAQPGDGRRHTRRAQGRRRLRAAGPRLSRRSAWRSCSRTPRCPCC